MHVRLEERFSAGDCNSIEPAPSFFKKLKNSGFRYAGPEEFRIDEFRIVKIKSSRVRAQKNFISNEMPEIS